MVRWLVSGVGSATIPRDGAGYLPDYKQPMAKSNILPSTLVNDFCVTGLTDAADIKAFAAFCDSEGGNLAKLADGEFRGLKLTGKGDKAKGTYKGAQVKFNGGHNAATIALHAATQAWETCESLGLPYGAIKADVSVIALNWKSKRDKKSTDTAKPADNKPESAPQNA